MAKETYYDVYVNGNHIDVTGNFGKGKTGKTKPEALKAIEKAMKKLGKKDFTRKDFVMISTPKGTEMKDLKDFVPKKEPKKDPKKK